MPLNDFFHITSLWSRTMLQAPKPPSALLNHIPSLPFFIALFSNKFKILFILIKSLLCARHSPECLNLFNPSVQPCEALLSSQYIVEKIMAQRA